MDFKKEAQFGSLWFLSLLFLWCKNPIFSIWILQNTDFFGISIFSTLPNLLWEVSLCLFSPLETSAAVLEFINKLNFVLWSQKTDVCYWQSFHSWKTIGLLVQHFSCIKSLTEYLRTVFQTFTSGLFQRDNAKTLMNKLFIC